MSNQQSPQKNSVVVFKAHWMGNKPQARNICVVDCLPDLIEGVVIATCNPFAYILPLRRHILSSCSGSSSTPSSSSGVSSSISAESAAHPLSPRSSSVLHRAQQECGKYSLNWGDVGGSSSFFSFSTASKRGIDTKREQSRHSHTAAYDQSTASSRSNLSVTSDDEYADGSGSDNPLHRSGSVHARDTTFKELEPFSPCSSFFPPPTFPHIDNFGDSIVPPGVTKESSSSPIVLAMSEWCNTVYFIKQRTSKHSPLCSPLKVGCRVIFVPEADITGQLKGSAVANVLDSTTGNPIIDHSLLPWMEYSGAVPVYSAFVDSSPAEKEMFTTLRVTETDNTCKMLRSYAYALKKKKTTQMPTSIPCKSSSDSRSSVKLPQSRSKSTRNLGAPQSLSARSHHSSSPHPSVSFSPQGYGSFVPSPRDFFTHPAPTIPHGPFNAHSQAIPAPVNGSYPSTHFTGQYPMPFQPQMIHGSSYQFMATPFSSSTQPTSATQRKQHMDMEIERRMLEEQHFQRSHLIRMPPFNPYAATASQPPSGGDSRGSIPPLSLTSLSSGAPNEGQQTHSLFSSSPR
eukprot:gnl/Carplike_NY0171/4647_a6312_194.p1 GENE.gnl/Carplike_NY0171/4647_a6312_194~~gnl/Carplike_NY0171/4647_a6312_194.p1  ORF type:complete len:654 (+),score=170.26 gnl/Carplike_NY0171/4647_a6312_194:253-1962(+)